MSWWERQWYKMLGGNVAIGGTLGVTGAITGPNVSSGADPGHTHSIYLPLTSLNTTDWTPVFTCSGSLTYTDGAGGAPTITFAKYAQFGKLCFMSMRVSGTTGGTASNSILSTLPITAARSFQVLTTIVVDGTAVPALAWLSSTTALTIRRYDSANYGLGADRAIWLTGVYEVA